MRARHWTLIACATTGLTALAIGCEPSNDVKGGPPQITKLEVVDSTGATVPFDADAGVPTVPPLVSFRASLDRIVNASALEQLTDGGPVGRPGVATVQTSRAGAMTTAQTFYLPNGSTTYSLLDKLFGFAPGPYVAWTVQPGLPSATRVTFTVNRALIQAKGNPAQTATLATGVSDTLVFDTEPFTPSFLLPDDMAVEGGEPDPSALTDAGAPDAAASDDGGAPADAGAPALPTITPDATIRVKFNNTGGDGLEKNVFVRVLDEKGAVTTTAFSVELDDSHTTVNVAPAMDQTWPVGHTVEVTVGPNAADLFGVKVAAPSSARFLVTAAAAM